MEASCTACSPCKHFLSTLAGTNTMTVCFTAERATTGHTQEVLSQHPVHEWWPMPSNCPQEANESNHLTQTHRYCAEIRVSGQFLLGLAPRI